MSFPAALFSIGPDVSTVREVIDELRPLGLQWQVEVDTAGGRVRALAPLFVDRTTGEIWAVAAVERWGSPRHLHNPGGIYGELVITLAGALDDTTDDGVPVQCVPGTALYHAPNTIHQATGAFWVGIYHQPRGSTPKPLPEEQPMPAPGAAS
jgi:hypothetical protein